VSQHTEREEHGVLRHPRGLDLEEVQNRHPLVQRIPQPDQEGGDGDPGGEREQGPVSRHRSEATPATAPGAAEETRALPAQGGPRACGEPAEAERGLNESPFQRLRAY